jgi:hypothetical protein
MLRRVYWFIGTDVSEKHIICTFRVKHCKEKGRVVVVTASP